MHCASFAAILYNSHAHLGICMACSAYSLCCNLCVCVCVVCVVVVCLCQPAACQSCACLPDSLSPCLSVCLAYSPTLPLLFVLCLLALFTVFLMSKLHFIMSPATTKASTAQKKKTKRDTRPLSLTPYARHVCKHCCPARTICWPCMQHKTHPHFPYHCRLFACRCRRCCSAAAAANVALVVAVVNFIYHLAFFTLFMLGGFSFSQRDTL